MQIKPVKNVSTVSVKPVAPREPTKVNEVDQIIISDTPMYTGSYEVTPDAHTATILETSGKKMAEDVTVKKIPCFSTSNQYGNTIYIASEV